ncbi:hypothetical protein VPHD518_0051 [Vibrio phage D518]
MTDQVDPQGEEEQEMEPVITAPFQVLEGNWGFPAFAFTAVIRTKKGTGPVWVQATNLDEFNTLNEPNPTYYNKPFKVAICRPLGELPAGTVIQVRHPGNQGVPSIDIDWIKASLYAHPERDHTTFLPEVELDAKSCNDVSGILRANDGCHPDSEFSNQYYS